jgi:P27 family predicted phage terminase small subunit
MKARQLVRTTGIVLVEKSKDGKRTISRNPISVELHKYREEMNRLLPELGLTPASRQKLTSLKLDEAIDDPFNSLMERMGRG